MATADDRAVIYKILPRSEWEAAKDAGSYKGAPVDLADGFMHFSTKSQSAETLRRYFAGQTGLVSLEIVLADLEKACEGVEGAKVQWDLAPSRGEDFPHLYGMPLPVGCVRAVEDIPDDRA